MYTYNHVFSVKVILLRRCTHSYIHIFMRAPHTHTRAENIVYTV